MITTSKLSYVTKLRKEEKKIAKTNTIMQCNSLGLKSCKSWTDNVSEMGQGLVDSSS
jgi:hypothetical protein